MEAQCKDDKIAGLCKQNKKTISRDCRPNGKKE